MLIKKYEHTLIRMFVLIRKFVHMSVFSKLKQFKDMREQGKKLQGVMAGETATARAAGDGVVLTMDGSLQITGLAISDELLNPTKKERLQGAIKEAHADAMKKMQRIMATKMQGMEGFGFQNPKS